MDTELVAALKAMLHDAEESRGDHLLGDGYERARAIARVIGAVPAERRFSLLTAINGGGFDDQVQRIVQWLDDHAEPSDEDQRQARWRRRAQVMQDYARAFSQIDYREVP